MKKILYFALAAGLTLSSCEQDLDIVNPNSPTTVQFWQNATDAQQGVNAIYSTLHRGPIVLWQWFYYTVRSDEAFSRSPRIDIQNNMDKFLITDYNFGETNWVYGDNYIGIFRANQALANIPEIEMDESLKARLLAEAKFFRGFFYYNLASLYGNVPIILEPSTPTLLPPNSTQQEVYAQAAQDLTEAAAVLPLSYSGENVGRVTKGAANALLAKVYMQQRNYQAALEPLQWLVEGEGSQVYGLMENYRDNFLSTTENNKESVFEWQFATNESEFTDNDVQTPNQNYGSPLAQFIGPANVGFSDAEVHRWVINEFHKEETVTGQRDPRLAASIFFDSTDVRGPEFSMIYGQTFAQRYGPTDNRAWFRKFANDAEPGRTGEGFRSANNYRFIRYSDVLLMYAETLNALGRTQEAYQYVDRVRQRVGLAPLSVVKPNLSQAAFLQQIMHERVTELSGEGHRWNDLARWGFFESQAAVNVLAQRDPAFNTFEVGTHALLPLPQRDVDINPNLVQNPGY
ncbi:RagB/SusD family nutrient uptake outer membrane protein [Pontibacter akesuensis]|uniref:Starch-binding associating with outer membrane n=1 Tax=Pontibacter akesuensis TaxID=388950 RepID=A0A1I7JD47_9BACT|nr:RagB/SusD family nutrient uptake outer membrane protein [Pontibacter akesuensis]GHA70793.1 membrane protein [Pontibacter akesuensis]SFU83126.1 Starch-binding associating with outer membrane [Pontibacter akesuensis]